MNIFQRLRARIQRADVAPIGNRLDPWPGDVHLPPLSEETVARLGEDPRARRNDTALLHNLRAFAAESAPDVVDVDGVAALLRRIRAHVLDDTTTEWTPDVLPDVSDTARPIIEAFLTHLEAELPPHKWALRWRLADVAHRYHLDDDRGGAG